MQRPMLAAAAALFALAAAPAPGTADERQACAGQIPGGAPEPDRGSPEANKQLSDELDLRCKRADGTAFYLRAYRMDTYAGFWSAYVLTKAHMQAAWHAKAPGKKVQPVELAKHPAGYKKPKASDYSNSGYSVGHLAPGKAMAWNKQAVKATYTTGNVAPQTTAFNNGLWALLEENVRAWACTYGELRVVTGVLNRHQGPNKIGDGARIWVPTHFYKALYTPQDGGHAIGFIYENDLPAGAYPSRRTANDHPARLEPGFLTLRELQGKVGLRFWPDAAEVPRDQGYDREIWPLKGPKQLSC